MLAATEQGGVPGRGHRHVSCLQKDFLELRSALYLAGPKAWLLAVPRWRQRPCWLPLSRAEYWDLATDM